MNATDRLKKLLNLDSDPSCVLQALQNCTPVVTSSWSMPVFTDKDIVELIQTVQRHIQVCIERDFSFILNDQTCRYLIKNNFYSSDNNLNPVNPLEAHKQALRNLNGMLIICSSLNDQLLLKRVLAHYHHYRSLFDNTSHRDAVSLVERLNDDFVSLLIDHQRIEAKYARKQLQMARDLSSLLEDQASVISLNRCGEDMMVEVSEPVKISEEFYDRELSEEKVWLQNARAMAGYQRNDTNTWLDLFFKSHFTHLKMKGVSPPPTARWLPFPAVAYLNSTFLLRKHARTQSFSHLRLGIIAPYEIEDKDEQRRLAKTQLTDVLTLYLESAFSDYSKLYQRFGDNDFFANYQTLLTPLPLLDHLHHYKDNNSSFVNCVKITMSAVIGELKKKYTFLRSGLHTNSAINRNAPLAEFKQDDDDQSRIYKLVLTAHLIDQVAKQINVPDLTSIARVIRGTAPLVPFSVMEALAQQLDKGKYAELLSLDFQQELALRMRAAFYLRALLDGYFPFAQLSTYQRNLMQGALEHLALSKQALTLISCKSARDRTGLMDSAIKAMLSNPKTMHDWQLLQQRIADILNQGHNFRTVSRYIGIMKLALVHRSYNKMMPEAIRYANNINIRFATKMSKARKFVNRFKSHFFSCDQERQTEMSRASPYKKNN